MRVVVAEDLFLLRDGLVRLLEAHGFEITEAVGTGPALLRALLTHRPDVAIVDVRLPPSFTDEGLQAALAARREVPGLPVLEKLFPRSRAYLPSAMGLGLAWVVPLQNSLAFLIGAVIVWVWEKVNKKNSDAYAIPIASGLVAGESLIAAFIAIACTLVGLMAMK